MNYFEREPGMLRRHWSLFVLVGVIVLAYVVQEIVGRDGYAPFMAVPAEIVRSWENLRIGTFTSSDLAAFGTLVSCTFLHADGAHLVNNMLFMWLFAGLAVELLGHRWMGAIFLFTGFTGSLCHVLFNEASPVPMLGASGAVMGFQGAYLGMAVRWRLPDPHVFPLARPIPPTNLVILAAVFVAIDWTSMMNHAQTNVAYAAHLGGFVGGVFLTSFIARKPVVAQAR